MKRLLLPVLFLFNSSAAAQGAYVEPLAGWSGSDGKAGVQLGGGSVVFSSPVIAEIDGNADNGKEIAVTGADGVLYVYLSSGKKLWQAFLPNYSCTKAGSANKVMSSPAVGELFGDGIPYVVTGYGGIGSSACRGGVAAYRGSDGRRRWHFNLKRFAKKKQFYSFSPTVFSTPSLSDVNGSGRLEIGFGSFDRNVYLLNSRGKPLWYYNAADTVWSSGLFVNTNARGPLELVIGTDISANSQINPPTENGGFIYAFKTTKRKRRRKWPTVLYHFRNKKAFRWSRYFDQVITFSPVAGDVVSSNPGPEIVTGAGCFFPQGSNGKLGRWIKILDAKTGKVLKTLTAPGCISSSAALADIDGDGVDEIIASSNGHKDVGGDGKSYLTAWDGDSGSVIWQTIPRFRGANDAYGANFQSPVAADFDGNGSIEVALANGRGVGIYRGDTGLPLTCQSASCVAGEIRLGTGGTLSNTPAVGDLNGDGILELVAAGRHKKGGGGLYVWTNFSLQSPAGTARPFAAPWPMWRGGALRAGHN